MQGRMSNPFLKANPFSSGLPPPPTSKYNNYLPTTSNSYEPSPGTSRYEPASVSPYSSAAQDYGQPASNYSNPFARDSLGSASNEVASSGLGRSNPFMRETPSFNSGRETSPWRPNSQQEYPPRASYNTITTNYDPQPVTNTARQRGGRNTPIKKKDNYLSTSSADSSSTFINRVYDTDDDKSEAASNPFLRKNLLPTNPNPPPARYTSPNSYDQSAMKQISHTYNQAGQNAVEMPSYRQSEPISYRANNNYDPVPPSTTRIDSYRSQPEEGGFGGYNGLQYRKGGGGIDPYVPTADSNRYDKNDYKSYQPDYPLQRAGTSKYNIDPYTSKQDLAYEYKPETNNGYDYTDKYRAQQPYSSTSHRPKQSYEPVNRYQDNFQSSPKFQEPYQSSKKYDPPSKYDIPSSKYDKYDSYEQPVQPPKNQEQSQKYSQGQRSNKPQSRYDMPPAKIEPTQSKYSMPPKDCSYKVQSKYNFDESSHYQPPPAVPLDQHPPQPYRSKRSIEDQSGYQSKKYKEYREYQYQGGGYDTMGGPPPKPISQSQVEKYNQPHKEESKTSEYRQDPSHNSRSVHAQYSHTNVVRFQEDEGQDSRYSRGGGAPTRDLPSFNNYPNSLSLNGAVFHRVELE